MARLYGMPRRLVFRVLGHGGVTLNEHRVSRVLTDIPAGVVRVILFGSVCCWSVNVVLITACVRVSGPSPPVGWRLRPIDSGGPR